MAKHKKVKEPKIKKQKKQKKIKEPKVKKEKKEKKVKEPKVKKEKKIKVKKEKKIKKPKLSPKELAAKQFKKEFRTNANYFKFLKRVGNNATKDFKKAKKEMKKGKFDLAKKTIAKYTVMDINAWVKAVE